MRVGYGITVMKNSLAHRTDVQSRAQSSVLVQFEVDGFRTNLGGSVFDGDVEMVVEITTNPQGARPGALMVLKADAADKLGLGCKPTIVNVVARPVNSEGYVRPGGMMDGAFLRSSDSRWPLTTPCPIHDRFEF